MSERKTKQSQALGALPMATGPLWLEEPLAQERLAGAQSSKGCRPLCLSYKYQLNACYLLSSV